MARAPRRAAAVALLCLLAVLAGCTVGPSQRPPVAVRGEDVPTLPTPVAPAPGDALPEPEAQTARIPFTACTEEVLAADGPPIPPGLRVECGEITAPADPGQPGLGGVVLGVQRVAPDRAPADRPPLLVLGDTAVDPSARHAAVLAGRVDPQLLARYTLVGLDRRGAGEDLLDCAPTDARARLVGADPLDTTESGLTDLLEEARAVVQECALVLDGGLTQYRTAVTAADVELLRVGLGVSRLSAVGVGDGASALADWARSAPNAVGRVVLDGPSHPTLDEPELSEARAGAVEAAVTAFALACGSRPDCPLGADPRATVTALVWRLGVRPLLAADGSRLTAGAVTTALLDGLTDPAGWPDLATALAAARDGDAAPLLTRLEPVAGLGGRFDGMLATSCNDRQRRLAPGEVAGLAARWRDAFPLAGSTLAARLIACTPWPAAPPPAAPGRAEGAPPMLVLGTAADPGGALEGSRRTAESLASARFLSWQGAGTGAYPRTPCVTGVVDAMLLDGVVPVNGTLCPP